MPDLSEIRLAAVDHLPGPTAPADPARTKKSRRGSERRARAGSMFIRLTDSERQEIIAAADEAGMEPGAYARRMALLPPEGRGSNGQGGEGHVTTRPTRLPFRVSAEERAQIEAAADGAGLTPGSYIRARALKRPVTLTTRRPPIERVELARLLGLVGNGTSNLNQIARQLNSGGEVPLVDVGGAVATMREAALLIVETLGRASRPRVRR